MHRVAWELTNGPIPAGMVVCHRCDNPPCCNPAHLFLGTQKENVRDMHSKGRARNGPRGWKLSEADFWSVKGMLLCGCRHTDVALVFGVNVSRIDAISTGRAYRSFL